VVAVGDGANDLPMLGIAGMGIAFRAKPIVRQTAGHAVSFLGLDSLLLPDRSERARFEWRRWKSEIQPVVFTRPSTL